MYYTDWKTAFNIALSYEEFNHVTLIMFTDPNCEVCNEFVPLLEELENDDYKVVIVENGNEMPFPFTFYPIGFVYIPHCPTKVLIRQGNAPLDLIKEDAKLQVTAMKQMIDYNDLKQADNYI